MINKLNEIQLIIIRLENKYEIMKCMIKEVSKNYANIIKTSIINTREKVTTKTRVRQR